MPERTARNPRRAEEGFALAAAMMVLALLSILAMAAVQSTSLEVQISARDRDARTALYAAEAGLEEARYYAARGWGKLASATPPALPNQANVSVDTPLPPGASWGADLYTGFTLVDGRGQGFAVVANSDAPAPLITVAAPGGLAPAPGRFTLVRTIAGGSWDGVHLTVPDAAWASVSGSDTWREWTLWDADGGAREVLASSVTALTVPPSVLLQLAAAPGSGPYTLAINPWLSALAGGQAPAGDAVPGTVSAWDRAFDDGAGHPVGTASVTAAKTGAGAFELRSLGRTETATRQVSLVVRRAGLATQQIGSWKVADGS